MKPVFVEALIMERHDAREEKNVSTKRCERFEGKFE
jgi:hypothetical protein